MQDDDFELPPEPKSEEAAREIINQIRFEHGHFDDNDEAELGKTGLQFQQRLRESARKYRKSLAAITKIVSTQLYSSKLRFIYELIQNADDSSYSEVIKQAKQPSVKFSIQPDKIVIDSNEDGFNVANVFAICATAQSSKKGEQDTTGEKGLGFKSVFAVANRVRVQSGFWSFEFKYPRGDDGLGMITPHWVDHSSQDRITGTIITLTLARKDTESLQELVKAFEDVPDTVLLFLRHIEKMIVSFEHREGEEETHVFSRSGHWNDSERAISVDLKGDLQNFEYKMWSKSIQAPSKAQVDDRDQPIDEPTTVCLAFPVDGSTSKPYVTDRGQHTFAFLPMKRMAQLPFIIQADFDTAASREAVTDELRNRRLRQEVARLFADAVGNLAECSEILRFSWTDYVPGEELDDFWKPLRQMIRNELAGKYLLVSDAGENFWKISDLRVVPAQFQHQGDPLFESRTHLSELYDQKAVATLQSIGLPTLRKKEMLMCVEMDLQKGTASRIMSTELEDSWHTTLVDLLHNTICSDIKLKLALKCLKILPVWSGNGNDEIAWSTPASVDSSGKIYFPQLDNDDDSPLIRPDLGLRTLHSEACVVPERREFYIRQWGITHAQRSIVVQAAYRRNLERQSCLVSDFVQQLAILFWHTAKLDHTKVARLSGVDDGCTIRHLSNLYLQSDETYSVSTLLDGDIKSESDGFIHQDFLSCQVKRHVREDGRTWIGWLEEIAGVRRHPRLTSTDSSGLSTIFQEIIRRKPSKVISTLKQYWNEYKSQTAAPSVALDALKKAHVQCRTGELNELSRTILPTSEMISMSRTFGVERLMRFLQIDDEETSVDLFDWSFLERFGVCCRPGLNFYLDVLRTLKAATLPSDQVASYASKIYNEIGAKVGAEDGDNLRNFFLQNPMIYASHEWTSIEDCVWKGPDFPIGKKVLANEYEGRYSIEYFFSILLSVGDASYTDIIEEIERLSLQNRHGAHSSIHVDTTTMAEIYSELFEIVNWDREGDEVKSCFERQSLVFDGSRWMKLSACVWSSAVTFPDRAAISQTYPDLENLFVKKLGIKPVTTVMMLNDIIRTIAEDKLQFDEVRNILHQISSMLANEERTDRVDERIRKLRELKFLPLMVNQNDSKALVSPNDTFFIVDDLRLGEAFRGEARLLDFAANELIVMQPLFASLGLERRYLSRCVKATTVVNNSSIDDNLTRDMQRRSYALSCCTLSHRRNDIQLYNEQKHWKLMNCEVLTSADMSTVLTVRQNGQDISVQSDMSDMSDIRVTTENGILSITVPEDQAQRRRCYRTKLPGKLMKWLEIVTKGAEKQLYRIINDPLQDLDEVLSEEGIPEIDGLERIEWEDDDKTLAASDVDEFVHSQSRGDRASSVGVDIYVTSNFSPFRRLGGGLSQHVRDNFSPDRYRAVLGHVVRHARAVPRQDESGNDAFDLTGMAEALDSVQESVTRSDLGMIPGQPPTPDAFKRIGAAGELFVSIQVAQCIGALYNELIFGQVFERLRAAGLLNLERSHWRSSIRHLVCGLPEFSDMARYTQAEIADIMYDDCGRLMEKLIRSSSFNDFLQWPESSPEDQFYIEVKTTINDCNEQFYMSQHQYKLLSDHALRAGRRPQIVYVVARVHNLLSSNIGVKFFVDPKSLEGHTLQFDWGDCAVTPRT